MVSERDTCISISITQPPHSSGHIMADNKIVAVYHHNTGNFDYYSCFGVFYVEGF